MVKNMAEKRIKRAHYNSLKESYLTKNRTMFSLYVELNDKIEVSRHQFFQLINKIRQEEGLTPHYK